MPDYFAEDYPALFPGRAHMLFAAKIVDAKDEFATHGSPRLPDYKCVEAAGPILSWIQSLLVAPNDACKTTATIPSISVTVTVDQLMPRAKGKCGHSFEGQNIVIQGKNFSKQPQKKGAVQLRGERAQAQGLPLPWPRRTASRHKVGGRAMA